MSHYDDEPGDYSLGKTIIKLIIGGGMLYWAGRLLLKVWANPFLNDFTETGPGYVRTIEVPPYQILAALLFIGLGGFIIYDSVRGYWAVNRS